MVLISIFQYLLFACKYLFLKTDRKCMIRFPIFISFSILKHISLTSIFVFNYLINNKCIFNCENNIYLKIKTMNFLQTALSCNNVQIWNNSYTAIINVNENMYKYEHIKYATFLSTSVSTVESRV